MGFLTAYARVLGLLAADRGVVLFLSIAAVALAGLQLIEPMLYGRVVDALSGGVHQQPQQLWRDVLPLLLIWGAAGLAGIACNAAVSLLADRLAHRNRLAVMRRFFRHVLTLPPAFHGETHSGRLMKVMRAGSDNLFFLWLYFFREQLASFILALGLLPMTLMLNWRLGLLLIVLVMLFAIATAFVVHRTQSPQEMVEELHSRLSGSAQDALANVVVVQSFTRLAVEMRLFGDITRRMLEHQLPVLNWWAALAVMARSASTLCVIAIFVLGIILNLRNQATLGEIVAFMGFATLLIGRMDSVVGFVSRLIYQMPALVELFAVLDRTNSLPEGTRRHELGRVRGEVAFEGVSFAYPNGSRVLEEINFKVAPGRIVALVGRTGAGKSTAMALLQRLWDPSTGRITIDGIDLRSASLDSLRRNIGMVFQDAMLFNRTIRENLLVGCPDASQDEIEAACHLAEAHDFILRQPNGYDTLIGERGVSLSGGQKQRLTIARVLLKDPPILVLDEATSALDTATEARVQMALRALMAGRTTFIIAHRLSTVRDADEILVFDQGRIVERGSFRALLRQGGCFAQLVSTQLARGAGQAA